MYIDEIVIDGFKSYAQRTVVSALDPFFNALTGLNGSGKSNVLDAICFVLGITNLSQVRAGSLQELVYKQGQAGVTKASVSVVFNNADRERSPVGYEEQEQITVTRQIVIGGRNKYLINGHVAQPSRVQNLFHSVQLNVNNPHFLIMQGRITKVLNMKPPEILSMLEEAAGTRMYESKKENALKTLDKKQSKVEEINKLLEDDILPALEKLRKERGEYMRWASANDKLERLRRFCVAYEFVRATAAKDSSAGGSDELKAGIRSLAAEVKAITSEIAQNAASSKRLCAAKDAQMGGDVRRLSDAVDEVSKHLVQENTAWANKKEALASERAAERKLQRAAEELDSSIAVFNKGASKLEAEFTAARSSVESLAAAADAAERTLSGVQSGKGTGDAKSLAEKLAEARAAASAAVGEAKAATLRGAHATKDLAAAEALLRTREAEGGQTQKELAARRAEADGSRAALSALRFDPAAAGAAAAARRVAAAAVAAAQETVDALSSKLAQFEIPAYTNPDRNFDRGRVKGVVAKLLRVKEAAAVTALEVLAGGRLYQLVVDSNETGKALLQRGQLRTRVTIIPLDRVHAKGATPAQVAAAGKASAGAARPALALVGFPDELQGAMQYVFGAGFVCSDAAAAKDVAFHPAVTAKTATLAGDLFDPAGTLTGGSRPGGESVLAKLRALSEAHEALAARKAELAATEAPAARAATAAAEHARLEGVLELAEHKLSLLKDRASASEAEQAARAVATAREQLAVAEQAVTTAQAKGVAAQAEATRLASEMESFSTERDKRLKAAERGMKEARAALAAGRAGAKAMEDKAKALAAEKQAAADERAAMEEQLARAAASVKAAASEAASLEARVAKRKAEHEAASAAHEAAREAARATDEEVSNLASKRMALERSHEEKTLELKKSELKVTRLEREAKEAGDRVGRLLAAHPWITAEKALFGRSGGDYDWTARAPEAATRELASLEVDQDRLTKTVNKKVLSMFDKAEAEYKELTEKRRIVLNDKSKIEAVIFELDEKKKAALVATWHQVDRDFGSIFSTLLPGASAKLEPPEGCTCLDGLEVKVAFGGVWKLSLSELSGGQRSLLALSLILALLLFKPAPIYILDEVDAALDLSHTQNIGRMIRTHFPQSQFIVVSLKEGMFQNANVIFRTKFENGISQIIRTVPSLQDKPHGSNTAQDDEAKRRRVGAAKSAAQKENAAPLRA